MRPTLERFVWRMWRGEPGLVGSAARLLLLPAEGVWRLVAAVRNRRFDRRPATEVDGLAVVSVGNVAVGGTGKTPFSAWVVRTLAEAGATPALLLRGYGDDEVRLHRHWNPDVAVEVGGDRVASARRARDGGAEVAVLDDGFQHRALARNLDVVLLAAADPVPGPVMPRGPYREPLSSLRRADVVVVTWRGAEAGEGAAVGGSILERLRTDGCLRQDALTGIVRLAVAGVSPLEAPGERGGTGRPAGALALTAIARPEAFRRDVEAVTGAEAELLAFTDHHAYGPEDARRARERAGDRPIYVTEKDAVKLVEHAAILGDTRVVRQELVWYRGEEEVRRRLHGLIERSAPPGRTTGEANRTAPPGRSAGPGA